MITSIYAGIFALFFIALSINVIKGRRAFHIAIGDKGQDEVMRRIRAHGNFTEYTPIFLILLGFSESNGLPIIAIHLFAIAFFIGRISHAYSLLRAEQYMNNIVKNIKYRIIGMMLTFTIIGIMAVINIILGLIS